MMLLRASRNKKPLLIGRDFLFNVWRSVNMYTYNFNYNRYTRDFWLATASAIDTK